MKTHRASFPIAWPLKNLALALVYFAVARFSLLLAFENTNASPVWPPSGIAFAIILFLGYRYWPSIAIGAFFANAFVFSLQPAPAAVPTILTVSFFIAAGNTLEALVGVFLLRNTLGSCNPLDKPIYLFRFLLIVPVAVLFSSVIGSLAVCLSRLVSWEYYLLVWFTWWMGDVAGIIVLSTLFLPWYRGTPKPLSLLQMVEAVFFLVVAFLIGFMVFVRPERSAVDDGLFANLFIPLTVWAVFRLGEIGLGITTLVFMSTTVLSTVQGFGPFVAESLNESLLLLEGFVGVVTLTGLVLMSALRDNRQAQEAVADREKWFRALIENSHDILTLIDERGKILYSSPSTTRVLGYKTEEYVGRIIFNFIHPEDIEPITKYFYYLLEKDGNFVSAECRFRHADGSWVWLEGSGINLIRERTIRAIVINCRDITGRKQASMDQARLAAIVDSTSDAIISKDLEGIITSWNDGAQRLYGFTAQEMIGTSIAKIIPGDQLEQFKSILTRLKRGVNVESMETVRRAKDGRLVDVSLSISLIKDSEGRALGASTIARDISQRKKAEEQLKRYAHELKVSNESLEDFAFVASHDLQEPLRIVASYVQLFTKKFKGTIDEDAQKYISYILENVSRMQEMISGLLEYSRVGRPDTKNYELDSSRACERAIANLDFVIRKKNAAVSRENLPRVWANDTELTRLFQNLIGNALKYCEQTPEIRIGALDEKDYWLFFVKDNGIGIDREYLEQVFDIFKRLHSKSEYPGTGMGLSICKKIVEKLGGKIWVESKAGSGSTFYFTMNKNRGER